MCLQTLTHIQLKNKLWTTVTFLRCCNLISGLANNNYSLYFFQFLTISGNLHLCYIFIPYCTVLSPIYSWTIEQIDRDIVLLLKITQIWVITICVVLDHNTVIFQKEKGVGVHISIHWRMLILECSQGCYTVKNLPSDLDLWPWKSIGFQTLLRIKYVPSLVKIHWRMLILECSQGCYAVKIWPYDLDLWPRKSIGFQILLRTKYVPSLVKIHWRMLILECSQGLWRTDGRKRYYIQCDYI
jgi:hypothetical protein